MTYIVSKRKGVWTVGVSGGCDEFDDYSCAVNTARGAAKVLEDLRVKRDHEAALMLARTTATKRPVRNVVIAAFSRCAIGL